LRSNQDLNLALLNSLTGIEEEDRWHLFIDTVCAGWIFETGINIVYSFSSEGEMVPVNPSKWEF